MEEVDYVLVGGLAIILHGMHRHTMDIDLFIKLERTNVERLRKALHSLYHDPDIEEITFQELQEYQVIRYGSPSAAIDLMTRQGEVIGYDDLEFEVVKVDECNIRVATPETLLKMKEDTVRPSDADDALFCRRLLQLRHDDKPG